MTPMEQLVEEQNRRAGRVVPWWRFYMAFVAAFIAGEVANQSGFWLVFVVFFVAYIVHSSLLYRYVKKGIR